MDPQSTIEHVEERGAEEPEQDDPTPVAGPERGRSAPAGHATATSTAAAAAQRNAANASGGKNGWVAFIAE